MMLYTYYVSLKSSLLRKKIMFFLRTVVTTRRRLDFQNNNCGCGWDGGDCCGANAVTKLCSGACSCLDPDFSKAGAGKIY
jgi:hypothetical protein